MTTLLQNGTLVQHILRRRPYHPWRHVPLAVFLSKREYPAAACDRIVDAVGDGAFLESMVVDGTLDPEDLAGAVEALDEGRAWWAQYSGRGVPRDAAITPPELDEHGDPTADSQGDPVYWERGEPAPIPEQPEPDEAPYEPSEDELAEWSKYLHELNRGFDAGQLEAAREWYRTRPSYGDWLESQGGPR